jgi:hypothetical protein
MIWQRLKLIINGFFVIGIIVPLSLNFFGILLWSIPFKLLGFRHPQRLLQRFCKGCYFHCFFTLMHTINHFSTTLYFYVPNDFWDQQQHEGKPDFALQGPLRKQKLAHYLQHLENESFDSISTLLSMTFSRKDAEIQRDILISNHQHNLDWTYAIYFCQRLDRIEDLCILLKDSIRKIPIFGPVNMHTRSLPKCHIV